MEKDRTIHDMSKELLLSILRSATTDLDTLWRVMRVCKRWRNLISEHKLLILKCIPLPRNGLEVLSMKAFLCDSKNNRNIILTNRLKIIRNKKTPVKVGTIYLHDYEFAETYYVFAALVLKSDNFKTVLVHDKENPLIHRNQYNLLSQIDPYIQVVPSTTNKGYSIRNFNEEVFCPSLVSFDNPLLVHKKMFSSLAKTIKIDKVTGIIYPELMKLFPPDKQETSKAALWLRITNRDTQRDMSVKELLQLVNILKAANINEILLLGDMFEQMDSIEGTIRSKGITVYRLLRLRNQPWFQELDAENSIGYQVITYVRLFTKHGMRFICGNMSGGMDGITMCGVPQIFFEYCANMETAITSRMGLTSAFSPLWAQVPIPQENVADFTFRNEERGAIHKAIGRFEQMRPDILQTVFQFRRQGA